MSTEPAMMIITALIRPHKEERVVQALHDLPEFPGFFVAEVRGQGRGRGQGGSYVAEELDILYHKFLQLQIICRPEMASAICQAVSHAAYTGRKGDGVIFTTAATQFVRIRESGGAGRSEPT